MQLITTILFKSYIQAIFEIQYENVSNDYLKCRDRTKYPQFHIFTWLTQFKMFSLHAVIKRF